MHWLLGLSHVFAEGLYPCRITKQESKLCGLWLSSLETNIVIIFYGLILIFSTSTLHWWRNIIYSLKEEDIKYIFQLLWKSGWEKEGMGMILLNGDLPLEIQPLKSKSRVVSRPLQDLSYRVCIHTIPFHFPPSTPHLPLSLEQASKQQELWLGLHLGNQWDWLYTKCCKVHEVTQPSRRRAPSLSSAQQPWGLHGATADPLAGTCAPLTAKLPPLLLLSSSVGHQHSQDSQKPKL